MGYNFTDPLLTAQGSSGLWAPSHFYQEKDSTIVDPAVFKRDCIPDIHAVLSRYGVVACPLMSLMV